MTSRPSWRRSTARPPTPVERRALERLPDPRRRLAFAARSLDRRTDEGDPVGRLRIARIGVSAVAVEGTDAADLRSGPGHYPGTPLPGQRGTVGIAGHRTTYGAPFRRIDKLRPRDPIVLEMPYGRFTYRVERTRIVPPTALLGHAAGVVRPAGALRLPSALFRGQADRRVRAPRGVPAARRGRVTSGEHPMRALAARRR